VGAKKTQRGEEWHGVRRQLPQETLVPSELWHQHGKRIGDPNLHPDLDQRMRLECPAHRTAESEGESRNFLKLDQLRDSSSGPTEPKGRFLSLRMLRVNVELTCGGTRNHMPQHKKPLNNTEKRVRKVGDQEMSSRKGHQPDSISSPNLSWPGVGGREVGKY